jgi:hypothetical protein
MSREEIWCSLRYIFSERLNWGELGADSNLTGARRRSTQRERDRLLGGHRRAFRPFQFKHDISKLSA